MSSVEVIKDGQRKSQQFTLFVDLDGTVFKYREFGDLGNVPPEPLAGAVEKMQEWNKLGYCIIITTARPERYRELTEYELKKCNMPYNHIVMDIGRGPRVLINDDHPSKPTEPRAVAVRLQRDEFIRFPWNSVGL